MREHRPRAQGAGELTQGWDVDAGPGAQMHGAGGGCWWEVRLGRSRRYAVVTSQIRGLRDSFGVTYKICIPQPTNLDGFWVEMYRTG
jgi:hypothetical protein